MAAPIDLAALLEESDIIFSPGEVAAPADLQPTVSSTPSPPPCAPAAEPTHYILVVSQEQAAAESGDAPSASSESIDDSEFEVEDTSRWSSVSTEPEQKSEPVKGTRKRAPRRPPATTPAEKYRRIRDNNKEASRRSREQRKRREADTESRAEQLQTENSRLREKVAVLEGLLEQVKALAPLLTAKR